MLLTITGCVSNTTRDVNRLPQLKYIDKTYPLVYEIKEHKGQIDSPFTFLAYQDKLIVENLQQFKIINLNTRKVLKSFNHKGISNDYWYFTPQYHRLLIASYNPENKNAEKVIIKDTKTWKTQKTFNGGGTSIANVGLSPDGLILFMEGALWSVNTGEKIIDVDPEFSANEHAFSNDNRYFIFATIKFGTRLFDIKARREIPVNSKLRDVTHPIFRPDNHYYATFNYDFNTSYQYGGDYPLSIGLFNAQQHKVVKQYNSDHHISCWTIMPDGKVFVARVNGDILLLSPELTPVKRWSIKQKARYCAADNNNIWLGVDNAGVYKIELSTLTIEHPINLGKVINKFILSRDGKYLGLQSVIDKTTRVQVYKVK